MTKEDTTLIEWTKDISSAWEVLMKLYSEAKLFKLAEKCKQQSEVAIKFTDILEAEAKGNEFFKK